MTYRASRYDMFTGYGYVNLAEMDEFPFSIDDVARILSKLARFNGHATRFYSVAEHSVLASHLVGPHLALEALLHDAHEAVTGDIAAPLKRLFPDLHDWERKQESHMRRRFKLPPVISSAVRWADHAMLHAEQRHLFGNRDNWVDDLVPAEYKHAAYEMSLGFWTPDQARHKFMMRYLEIKRELLK